MTLPAAAQRVQEAIEAHGLDIAVIETSVTARTAQEAATAVGVAVGQIVKSLVFERDGDPVLLLVSGSNRVDTERLGLQRADADRVREATGYAIGGIPPIGLRSALAVTMDADLMGYDVVWAAAGTPTHVFAIAPDELLRISGATVARVA